MNKLVKDLHGLRFGHLVALKYVGASKWLFRCDCGNEKVIESRNATSGHTTSCGCVLKAKRIKYHVGQRFGNVVLLNPMSNGKWLMRCDCGREFAALVYPYKVGRNRTCGCSLYDGSRQTKHNKSRTDTYHIWQGLKRRCNNPHFEGFKDYGGRGIKVCDRWNDSFENFLADMGERPGKEYSIDRIDVNGNYEPSNCRWATWKEQMNNTTRTIYLSHNGVTHPITEWCEIYGIPQRTAHGRYQKGYSFEKIFGKSQVTRKLTDEEVRAVRTEKLTATSFLKRFGKKISNSTLRNIKNNQGYTDVI